MGVQSLISSQKLDSTFRREIEKLRADWKPIKKLHQDLTKKQIRFGEKVLSLFESAKTLDKQEEGEHYAYLRSCLQELIGSTHPAILSKWLAIGRQASNLLSYSTSLPPQRDSLYEIALAADDKKPIEKWIRDGSLTPESTFREVASLRRPKPNARRGKAVATRSIAITLTLASESYDEAAACLKDLIRQEYVKEVDCHPGFREAFKSVLGRDSYEQISQKFS